MNVRWSVPALTVVLLLVGCDGGGGETASANPASAQVKADTGFIDRTLDAGFTFKNHTGKEDRKDFIVEAKGGGALVLDYDQDGDMDLYVVDGNTYEVDEEGNVISRTTHPDARNRLMRNDGNWKFTDVTEEAGVGDVSYGFGGGVGDYDNDGWPDMHVCNWGKNILYRNNGDGTFTDVTDKAGVGGEDSYYSTCSTFFDADGDGDLDLYVSNYNDIGAYIKQEKGIGRHAVWRDIMVYAGPNGIPEMRDEFFRNNGDGTFTNETETALRNQEPRFAFTSVASDLDNDGDLDLYVVNDIRRNTLWVNDGTGHFDDKGEEAGVDIDSNLAAQAGMGNDAADYDQDGLLDIITCNFDHDKNTLYKNRTKDGRLNFEDVTERAGLAREDFFKVCWGTKFVDFNQDGYLDLFIAAGHVYKEIDEYTEVAGTTYKQLPSLWYNQGPPRWTFKHMNDEVGGPGLKIPKTGRAACFADFDDDGDIDVYISGLNDTPLLLENRLPKDGNWFMLDLVGKTRDRDAIGARATVIAGNIHQMQEKRLSASFINTNDPRLHWGTGKAEKIDLEVKWMGGATQTFKDVAVNHLYRLVEGGELERLR